MCTRVPPNTTSPTPPPVPSQADVDLAAARLKEARRRIKYELPTFDLSSSQHDNSTAMKIILRLLNDFNWQPPIDPSLVAAREYYCTIICNGNARKEIESGKWDDVHAIPGFMAGVEWSRKNKETN